MKLSELKDHLSNLESIQIQLPNGSFILPHFHITEVGMLSKHFIDCGGTVRVEHEANLQVWVALDIEHRLKPQKLINIIRLSERKLNLPDLPIVVEYQGNTIEKYDLEFDGINFKLKSKQTACLATDHCGIKPEEMPVVEKSCCAPGGGCC